MLKDLIAEGYGEKYNCAEIIINGANQAYELGIDEDATRLFASFGGGLAIGDTCGAVCSSMGVISRLFVTDTAQTSEMLSYISRDFLKKFKDKTGSLKCKDLEAVYGKDGQNCAFILESAGEILDELMNKYAAHIVKKDS